MASVELTDEVRQDASKPATEEESAAAYLVFDVDGNDRLFADYGDAERFAEHELSRSGGKGLWSVYPLYAGEPLEVT